MDTVNKLLAMAAFLAALETATVVGQQITLSVEANGKGTPISDNIYCLNEFEPELQFFKEISLPLNRWGGNAVTRFNYINGCTNRAADWFFMNGDFVKVDEYMAKNQLSNTKVLMTAPAIGWVAKDSKSCGFPMSLQKSDKVDTYTQCGNGESAGKELVSNDPKLTSTEAKPAFITDMVRNISAKHKDQIVGWELDNEVDLWFYNHRDVAPVAPTCSELEKIGMDYGNAIKAAEPTTKVLGPVVSNWRSMFLSPAKVQKKGPSDCVGGVPFLKDYMKKLCNGNSGRLLDYADVHYYEAANGVTANEGVPELRMESTRSLWDKTYEDKSWYKDIKNLLGGTGTIALVPTMKQWIAENCPGTKIAITEWSFGGSNCPKNSGALAHADVLGIFGREGVDLACYWHLGDEPLSSQQNAYAMRMFRNYDGKGSKFGDISVPSNSSDQTKVSIFAAQDSKTKKLTAVIINKSGAQQTVNLHVEGAASAGRRKRQAGGKSYQYSGGHEIKSGPEIKAPGSITLPANSITTVELGTGSASAASPSASG